ncbi:putative multicopperoxidase [Xylariales sp. PMI_506]|nr:putative multicopperoxidase [Xylariales sp. PMI_506]
MPSRLFKDILLQSVVPLAWLLSLASAATVVHDFNIEWVTANPDGAFDRPTIGVNGHWPLPVITANVGDNIVIHVKNSLGNQTTSLHFHGLFMKGTNFMDGPAQVTQCPIPIGGSFTYNFTIDQPGTYWYHSHSQGQYPDGLRAPLIIHDPKFPHKFDEEVVLSVSDWYHDQMRDLIPAFMHKTNPTGAEPVPDAALLNDTQNLHVPVQPGKTYFFRMINIGAFAGQYIWFEGHTISIVEVDGVYTEPAEADMIYLSAGQRCSFLLTTKKAAKENFAIVASMDMTLFDVIPDDLNPNVTGWLVYDETKPNPKPAFVDELEPFDDMELVPLDRMELLPEPKPERIIELNVIMDNLMDGANYAFFNNITYKAPKTPTLYTALTSGELATNPLVYGSHTNSFVLEKDEVVQIVLNNLDSGRHPFHLHGHQFQTIYRSPEEAGTFADSGVTEADFPEIPMRRDTIVLWPEGNVVLRFKADNPGVWLFHCHIEWHVESGLIATLIEAPLELQRTQAIPQAHLDTCNSENIPTTGNAAGNDEDLLDLTGENSPPGPLPAGFTTRGIIALVFSCVSGIVGTIVVAVYGIYLDGSASDATEDDGDGDEDENAAANPGGDETTPLLVTDGEMQS